jgi:hypothetical protein
MFLENYLKKKGEHILAYFACKLTQEPVWNSILEIYLC